MTTTAPHTLTNDQAADLLTAASLRDVLNCRGGVALTDHLREQHRQQLDKVQANIPADLARAAWTEAAARDPKATLANAMFAWLREQNVTD